MLPGEYRQRGLFEIACDLVGPWGQGRFVRRSEEFQQSFSPTVDLIRQHVQGHDVCGSGDARLFD